MRRPSLTALKTALQRRFEDMTDPTNLTNRAAKGLIAGGDKLMSLVFRDGGFLADFDQGSSSGKQEKASRGPLGDGLRSVKGEDRVLLNEELNRASPMGNLDTLLVRYQHEPAVRHIAVVAQTDPYEASLLIREWYGQQSLAPDKRYHDEAHELKRSLF